MPICCYNDLITDLNLLPKYLVEGMPFAVPQRDVVFA
jgi:hypothetical protein